MARKLYVGNLPYTTGEQDLEALFAAAGTVESVSVMRDMATGRARGFAFVEMATDEEAQNAISQFNNYSLGGRNLTVNEARPKTAACRRLRWRRWWGQAAVGASRAGSACGAVNAARTTIEERLNGSSEGHDQASRQ